MRWVFAIESIIYFNSQPIKSRKPRVGRNKQRELESAACRADVRGSHGPDVAALVILYRCIVVRARARATSSCTVYVCIFTYSLRSGLIIASCDPLQYYVLQRHLRLTYTCTCIVVRAVRNVRQTCRLYNAH